MRKLILITILIVTPLINWSQSISGKIVDQDKNPLEFVAVAVMNPADSLLISYATTDETGAFELKQLKEGKILVQAHLIGFATYQKTIDFKNESINLGDVVLAFENELDEVIVRAVVPISIKTDTVAYNTKAFKVRVEDNVEDLLKKLPGVEVDAAGKVTAQGEEITKIYVDGKEFFSGDPAIATKNLSADAIKSIEIIDEKSEKARVSGVNDQERAKVINLKLKDDKKVNDFGKVQGGYGTDDRYLTSLNYNRFSSKLQTSIIGKYNNVNTSGSDISEIISFDTGNGRWGSQNQSGGFLTTGVGGINMGYEIKKNQNLNADYFYNYAGRTSGDVYTTRIEYIDDAEIKSDIHSRSESESNRNNVNFSYRDRSSKLRSVSIRARGGLNRNSGQTVNTLDKYNANDELDLQSIGNTHSSGDNNSGSFSLDYTKRFKEGSKRNIEFEVDFGGSNNENLSTNNQLNKFNISDPANAFDIKEETVRDQNRKQDNYNFEFEYTEPITEKHLVEIAGKVNGNNNDNDVHQVKYENDILQTPLIFSEFYQQSDLSGRVRYKYDNDKFTLSAGARVIDQTQDFGVEAGDMFKNSYTNVNPEVNIRYNPKKGEFFRFSTRKRVILPSSTELSPVVNDFNPLFIRVGNPNLIPEDDYYAFVMYGRHDFSSGFSFFGRLSYNYTTNSIGNSEFTDNLGIRYSSYENLGDKNNFSSYLSLGNRINSLGVRYNIRLRGNYTEYFSMINTEINETQTKSGSLSVSLENNKKEKVDASIGATWDKNYTTFTTGNNADRDYLKQTYYSKIDWNVTNKLNINSQFKYDIYSDSNFGSTEGIPIWNATVAYALTPSNNLNVMISALDILNKSIGLQRTSSDNYFEETQRDVLGNYYMLSLTYNLNGNKGPKKFGGNSNRRYRRSH